MRFPITTDYIWQSGSWQATNQLLYVYDGNLVLREWRDGALTTYTRGNDLSGSIQGAGGIGGLLARSATSIIGPDRVLEVSGAGTTAVNGLYYYDGEHGTYTNDSVYTISSFVEGVSKWGFFEGTDLKYHTLNTDLTGTWYIDHGAKPQAVYRRMS